MDRFLYDNGLRHERANKNNLLKIYNFISYKLNNPEVRNCKFLFEFTETKLSAFC